MNLLVPLKVASVRHLPNLTWIEKSLNVSLFTIPVACAFSHAILNGPNWNAWALGFPSLGTPFPTVLPGAASEIGVGSRVARKTFSPIAVAAVVAQTHAAIASTIAILSRLILRVLLCSALERL